MLESGNTTTEESIKKGEQISYANSASHVISAARVIADHERLYYMTDAYYQLVSRIITKD